MNQKRQTRKHNNTITTIKKQIKSITPKLQQHISHKALQALIKQPTQNNQQ